VNDDDDVMTLNDDDIMTLKMMSMK